MKVNYRLNVPTHTKKKKRKEKGKIQQVSNERLRTSNPNQLPSVSLRYIV